MYLAIICSVGSQAALELGLPYWALQISGGSSYRSRLLRATLGLLTSPALSPAARVSPPHCGMGTPTADLLGQLSQLALLISYSQGILYRCLLFSVFGAAVYFAWRF